MSAIRISTSEQNKFQFFVQNFTIQAIFFALLSIGFYINTWQHEYALDDAVVIVQNEYVHKGLAGLGDILTKDAYDCYYKQLKTTNSLKGGRYRPLSIVTFAIEQQLFGPLKEGEADSIIAYGLSYEMTAPYELKFLHEMHIRHMVNTVLFAISVVILLYFLRFVVFKGNPLMAFLATLIFAIHPIHTEVVANVKSRDEIMSLIFICLTFIFAFKYFERKNIGYVAAGMVCYLFAFLSKEYAVSLIILLPLAFYIFNRFSIRKSLLATIPYLTIAGLYVLIRFFLNNTNTEVEINNIQVDPYAYATSLERIATEIATSLNYLKLLFFPHPLCSDYSYNQIPYKEFSSPLVWISMFIHLSLLASMIFLFVKRQILCFALAFYFFNFILICNLLFGIGATMGERLIYHSSVGFAIAIGYLSGLVYEKIKNKQISMLFSGMFILLIFLCGIKTIARNEDWKNNETLYLRDIKVSPNSFFLNTNAAGILINRSDGVKDEHQKQEELHRAIELTNKAMSMQDNYILGYFNKAAGYYKLNMPDSMTYNLNMVQSLYPPYPGLPMMYFHASELYFNNHQFKKAADQFRNILLINPDDNNAKRAVHDLDSIARSVNQF